MQVRRELTSLDRLATRQQRAQGAAFELLERRHTHPGGKTRAGQRHVQLAQVLPQALAVHAGQPGRVGLQVHPRPALVVVPLQRQVGVLGGAVGAGKGQKYQRVLQPLGLVHRDHLHQVGIAFQPQLADVAVATLVGALLGQMADQRMLAVELPAGLLHQLGQVQHIGQRAFVVPGQQPARHLEVVQQAAQHRQHALAPPHLAVTTELQHPLLPMQLVVVQPVQFGPRQPQCGGADRRAQQPVVVGLGAGGKPVLQVAGHGAGVHRLLVRQVDAANLALTQGPAQRLRLAAGVHQHGDVARLHRPHRPVARPKARPPLLAGPQQPHHLGGADRRHLLLIGGGRDRVARVELPEAQRRRLGSVDAPALVTPARSDLDERHRVVIAVAEEEGARPRALLGPPEHLVDRGHHRPGGAEVGAQRAVAACSVAPRCQVGVDVGAAEGVDRLLGVADQHQRGLRVVARHAVDRVEDAVLQRIGVLELVDQRHRELLADQPGQARAVGALQRGVQPRQQIVETHLGPALLLVGQARGDPARGVAQQLRAAVRQGLDALAQRQHVKQRGMVGRRTLGPGIGQALRRQAGPSGAAIRQRQHRSTVDPLLQCLQPRLVIARLELAAVHLFGGHGAVEH